jgi:hypothetical protein
MGEMGYQKELNSYQESFGQLSPERFRDRVK